MIIRTLLIACSIVLFQPSLTAGYDDQTTHPDITKKAVSDVSNLNFYLKTTLGLEKGIDSRFPSNSQDPKTSALELLKSGSTAEDSPACRAANHFHDPLKPWWQSGMSDEPLWLDIKCAFWLPKFSNITWATGYLSPPPDGQKQTFTTNPDYAPVNWDKARDYYYKALTSTTNLQPPFPPGRDYYFANTFQYLGNVLHLLQDMAVPAHVRNDFTSHIAFNGKTSSEFVRWFGNHYEYYVQTHTNAVTGITDAAIKYPSFTNTRLTDFWDTDQYNGNNPSSGLNLGLAEFTNANYLSDSTIPYTLRMPYHMYTYPKIDDPNIQICIDYEPGSTRKRVYLSRKDRGSCPPITEARSADHFAALGFWNNFSVKTIIDSVLNLDLTLLATPMSLDDNVHKTYANDILPHAVGYSAGLLDYFFRGTIDITVPSNGIYSMIDATQSGFDPSTATFTAIKLKATNTTTTGESMTNGTIQLVVKYKVAHADPFQPGLIETDADFSYIVVPEKNNVNALYSATPTELNFDVSQNPIPLWATDVYLQVVFKGTLGNEVNAVAVGFKDISEPTPIDFTNNMDKICINGSWYDAGSPEAIDQVDTNHDGIANEFDVYAHDKGTFYVKFAPYSTYIDICASPTLYDFMVSSLAAGSHIRASYILSDYQFDYCLYNRAYVKKDPKDPWPHYDHRSGWMRTAIKRQKDYTEDSGLCGGLPSCYIDRYPEHSANYPADLALVFYDFRGISLWWGGQLYFFNSPYPLDSECSYDLL
jgi:hypothetical protein